MNKISSFVPILWSFVLGGVCSAGTPIPGPSQVRQSAVQVPVVIKISSNESKALLSEFTKAQRTEIKALEHRYKFEMRELKASQNARRREWEKKEQEARHHFFADHSQGRDRRAYVQDFIRRRELLTQMLTDERTQRIHDQEVRSAAVSEEQASRLKSFKQALDQGVRPPLDLWPQPGI